ncbi:unnamed protein product, partial [Meganyctiphanes norvegica]
GGFIPLNLTYNNSIIILQWKTPTRGVIKYIIQMTPDKKKANEHTRRPREATYQQDFASKQQVCVREFTKEITKVNHEDKTAFIFGSEPKFGMGVTPCPHHIYYIVFIAVISDRCPDSTSDKCEFH